MPGELVEVVADATQLPQQSRQLAPFDLVLLLVLSNAVQNSMNGGDNSLTGGLVSATPAAANAEDEESSVVGIH